MKKLIVGLFVAALVAAGLVAFSPSPANADCPYTGCVRTNTTVNAPARADRGDRARICVRVTTNGSGQPRGNVILRVSRNKGGYRFSDAKQYRGGQTCFVTTRLGKRGRYTATAKFQGRGAFRNSNDRDAFRVTRR